MSEIPGQSRHALPATSWPSRAISGMGRRYETGNQDFDLVFCIIFFAIPSATICSERGMKGLLLQPGREEEGFGAPGSHRVTG